jgi:hypothetical protein
MTNLLKLQKEAFNRIDGVFNALKEIGQHQELNKILIDLSTATGMTPRSIRSRIEILAEIEDITIKDDVILFKEKHPKETKK